LDLVRALCSAYRERAATTAAATAAATESDAVPDTVDGSVERNEQQEQLSDAYKELLDPLGEQSYLRELELAEVRTAVNDAIAAGQGTSVLVSGPAGCGKRIAMQFQFFSWEWWHQFDRSRRSEPFCHCFDLGASAIAHPAGLYGYILQQLAEDEGTKIGDISELVAEAKKQLEALLFDTKPSSNSSGVTMIVVVILGMDIIASSHADELQQLYEWAQPTSRLILIGIARSDLVPRLQQQVVFKPYTEGDLVAILRYKVDTAVQPALLELCAKQASGNAWRAGKVCAAAIKLALRERSVVTSSHMEEAAASFDSE
jgi:Cdc6-like AAA superfamily ATPase